MTTTKPSQPNFATKNDPIFTWSIRDLMETRQDSSWHLMSEDQAAQVCENVSQHTDRTDDRLYKVYADAVDEIYDAVKKAVKSTAAARAIIDASPKPAAFHQPRYPAESCYVFSLYWYEFVEGFELPDLTNLVASLPEPHQALVNQVVATVAARHLTSIRDLYLDWTSSLQEDQISPRRPPMSQTYQ